MIITIDTAKKLTEVEVNLLKVLLGTSLTAKKQPEKAPEATKVVEPEPEVKVEVETPSEASEKKVEKSEASMLKTPTLAELKALAQDCVKASDRSTVKAVINMFAPKLTEVKESDYIELSAQLEKLKG